MKPARARAQRLAHHFAELNAQARYAPPIAVHGGEAHVIRGSDGSDIHVWTCVCSAGGRAPSADAAQDALAAHLAKVSP